MARPLRSGELFWVELRPFLLKNGYKLRPRFDPDRKPSWQSEKQMSVHKRYEDGIPLKVSGRFQFA